MCGIAGIVAYKKGPDVAATIDAMLTKLGHRGPDDSGSFRASGVAIGQTRLSIIDLAGGHQPLYSVDGRYVLVANGEIYNYIELRRELEALGQVFLTSSDSETIIAAYQQFGPGFVSRLEGMFAFALYDKVEGRLVLVRDRLGIKPLFIYENEAGCYFASEIKALLPFIDKVQVKPSALAQYLQHQFIGGHETIVDGISKLMPGTVLEILAGGAKRERTYWTPFSIEPWTGTNEEAVEQFDALFHDVMDGHLRSDVPYGLFLSSGTDSAAIALNLSRREQGKAPAFTIGFSSAGHKDEVKYSSWLSEGLGLDHRVISVDRKGVLDRLAFVTWSVDDLMRDPAVLPTSVLAEAAAREVKVVLTGEGGDEVFAGYGRYRRGALQRLLQALATPGSGGFRTRGLFDRRQRRKYLRPELADEARRARYLFSHTRSLAPKKWSEMAKRQYVDLATYLCDDLLVKTDRTLMAFGLEGRVPFLDHRIVSFGLSLPDDLKVRGREGKVLLKRWLGKALPSDYVYRKKRGFHVPLAAWLNREYAARLMPELRRDAAMSEWFNMEEIEAGLASGGVGSGILWSLLQFCIWNRIFVEQDGNEPPIEIDPLDYLASTRA